MSKVEPPQKPGYAPGTVIRKVNDNGVRKICSTSFYRMRISGEGDGGALVKAAQRFSLFTDFLLLLRTVPLPTTSKAIFSWLNRQLKLEAHLDV